MKYSSVICALIFIAGILLMLAQLWFAPWEPEVFIKLILTVMAFLVIAIIASFVHKEIGDSRRLKNGGELDP